MTSLPALPPTRRQDVADIYHGVAVADPYRWLEDGDSPEVIDWVARQNLVTRAALDRPERARWHERLVALMQLPVLQSAQLRGDQLVCTERPAAAEQFVLTRRSASESGRSAVTLVDPAVGSSDATNAIDWFEASPDGSLIALGLSEGGTEESVLRVISADDGAAAGTDADEIPDTRACSVAWEPDGSGFYYTRYPAGDHYHRTVHYHRRGCDWRDDPVVWTHPSDPQAWPSVSLSVDGRWLCLHVSITWSQVDVHVLDRTDDSWTTVVEGVPAVTALQVSADGGSLVGVTTIDAPRGRVVRVLLGPTLGQGSGTWETLVAEREDVITQLGVTRAGLIMITSRGAVDTVHRLDPDGRRVDDAAVIGLGDVVAIADLASSRSSADAFLVVDSYGAPTALWRLADHGVVEPFGGEVDASALTGELTVRQVEYSSLDGTSVGLFLIHRADVTPSADTPTILNGYGGFAISESPIWRPQIGAWCAAGGLYAIAGLRGGIEHGEDWHLAGLGAHKQNVFDDFHAAADHLVSAGLTSRARLAVHGRSNGGLLMGVALTQRPDLARAVWCGVALLDMIRFPKFLIARLWTSEYGDPDIAEEFAWLYAYSPYHHVRSGTCYPATLIQTAEGDTRVDPLHARKMVALLQSSSSCQDTNPVLLSQEGRAGHGVGKPVGKRADEVADALTFLGGHIGLVP